MLRSSQSHGEHVKAGHAQHQAFSSGAIYRPAGAVQSKAMPGFWLCFRDDHFHQVHRYREWSRIVPHGAVLQAVLEVVVSTWANLPHSMPWVRSVQLGRHTQCPSGCARKLGKWIYGSWPGKINRKVLNKMSSNISELGRFSNLPISALFPSLPCVRAVFHRITELQGLEGTSRDPTCLPKQAP